MARCLIVGCGCRGRSLARELRAGGHTVRGTTRREAGLAALQAAGVQPHLGDPDRVATLAPALEHVSVACLLLGSAAGSPEALRALHGSRLEMLLTRMVDSTVHGIVYESAGSVSEEILGAGTAIVRAACQDSRIPFALLGCSPDDHPAWLAEAHAAVEGLLSAGAR